MRNGAWFGLIVGVLLGAAAVLLIQGTPRTLVAGNGDRYEDYVMCTGAISTNAKGVTDGVWLLDYRSGKLLGTAVDRTTGSIAGWSEVDLVAEFNIAPKTPVHFLMTTGNLGQGQAALYITETGSAKFGVYTMAPNANGPGVSIRRHDLVVFRKANP